MTLTGQLLVIGNTFLQGPPNTPTHRHPPGTDDDVTLDGTGVPNQTGGVTVQNSIVDADFSGTIKSLTVKTGYTKTITLNKNLHVDGHGASEIDDGTITGSGQLTFESSNDGPKGSLTWKGGTIAANTIVDSTSTLSLTNNAAKKLDGKEFLLQGAATWDGQGTLDLTNAGEFQIGGSGSMTISGATTVNGTATEQFRVFGTLQISVGDGAEMVFRAALVNENATSLTQGNFRTDAFRNSGTLTIGGGSEARLGANSPVGRSMGIQLDSTQGANKSEITGSGKAVFLPGSSVMLTGTAKVVNVDDQSATTDTQGTGDGNLEISGTYNWQTATGNWKGTGTTTLKASGTLNLLGTNLTIARNAVNQGIVNWHSTAWPRQGPKITLDGIWDNQAGAVFDITYGAAFPLIGTINSAEIAGTGIFKNNGGLLQNQTSDADVIIRPRYQETNGGRVKEKSAGATIPLTTTIYRPYALRFIQRVASADGIFDIESNAAIAFDGGADVSGGQMNIAGAVAFANGVNISGGTIATAYGVSQVWFDADTITQTGGSLTFADTTGSSTFNATVLYDFEGGSANIQEPTGTPGTIQQLLVNAAGISLGGSVAIPYGTNVTPYGTLVLNTAADVGGNILVDGTLHVAWTAHMTGDLTNNGLLHLGLPGNVNSTNILNITGNYQQAAGATLLMDLAGMNYTASGSDVMYVSGNAALAGNLVLLLDTGATAGGTYTLIHYGWRSGTFDSVSVPSGSGLIDWYDSPTAFAMGVWQGGGGGGGGGGIP